MSHEREEEFMTEEYCNAMEQMLETCYTLLLDTKDGHLADHIMLANLKELLAKTTTPPPDQDSRDFILSVHHAIRLLAQHLV